MRDMDIDAIDRRGSTPLHWACYSKSEYALCYILAMKPDLEVKDITGLAPIHLAIKSVGDLNSTRPVRALLLKGARRDVVNNQGQKCMDMIKDDVSESLRKELEGILKEPKYNELCMFGSIPMVPLQQNHKTQSVFIFAVIFILACQFLIVLPSKSGHSYILTLSL